MCPLGRGQIHTSVHAGGTARSRMRSRVSPSVTRLPDGAQYVKPWPARRRLIPGVEQSLRASRMGRPVPRAMNTEPMRDARFVLPRASGTIADTAPSGVGPPVGTAAEVLGPETRGDPQWATNIAS